MSEGIVEISCRNKSSMFSESVFEFVHKNPVTQPKYAPTNSSLFVYVKQFGNWAKKSLDGCDGTTTNFPIPNASATVVQSTSLVEGLMKICKEKSTVREKDRANMRCSNKI